jgi:mono/diheme cytochrome c family protein
MKKHLLIYSGMIILAVLFLAFASPTQDTDWVVPDKYQKMENPIPGDKGSLSVGKELYTQHCKSCHGKEGMGDGSKAAQLDTPCGDFTSEEFQEQSDGVIFYKSWIGRDEMPNFEKKIPDSEDVWSVVNYMRTLEE